VLGPKKYAGRFRQHFASFEDTGDHRRGTNVEAKKRAHDFGEGSKSTNLDWQRKAQAAGTALRLPDAQWAADWN
jgi:hypothetical protein